MRKNRLFKIFACGLVALTLTGCNGTSFVTHFSPSMKTSQLFAMDTIMELQINGDEALLTEAESRIRDLEKKLSTTDENSEISRLNRNKSETLSKESGHIFKRALEMCKETDGALDISIYPVLKRWGFTTGTYSVPSDEELAELLAYVDYSQIELKDDLTVSVPEGMEVDLGSVVKGYTGTMLSEYFVENGVTSGLINLGGNVQCIGTKPNGEKWKVAIKSPFPDSQSGIYGVLNASDTAIITSGGYERFFEENGETYWHILDPSNGKPAGNGLISVTVIGKDGLRCDALSTALFVKGLDEAMEYYREHKDFDAILIADDGTAYVTAGAASDFTLSSEYYNKKIVVISD